MRCCQRFEQIDDLLIGTIYAAYALDSPMTRDVLEKILTDAQMPCGPYSSHTQEGVVRLKMVTEEFKARHSNGDRAVITSDSYPDFYDCRQRCVIKYPNAEYSLEIHLQYYPSAPSIIMLSIDGVQKSLKPDAETNGLQKLFMERLFEFSGSTGLPETDFPEALVEGLLTREAQMGRTLIREYVHKG